MRSRSGALVTQIWQLPVLIIRIVLKIDDDLQKGLANMQLQFRILFQLGEPSI